MIWRRLEEVVRHKSDFIIKSRIKRNRNQDNRFIKVKYDFLSCLHNYKYNSVNLNSLFGS